ncbi:MAG: hypothetical protein AAF517_03840 [Planctomycetota bacterium]
MYRRIFALICVSTVLTVVASAAPRAENSPSEFAVTIDGAYSGGLDFSNSRLRGAANEEWSDVVPLGFIHASERRGLRSSRVGHYLTDALYAAVLNTRGASLSIDTCLASLGTTRLPSDGVVARVAMPFYIDGRRQPAFRFVVTNSSRGGLSFRYDQNGDGKTEGTAAELGISAAVGFGPSPLSRDSHLVLEIRWPAFVGRRGIDPTSNGIQLNMKNDSSSEIIRDGDELPRGHSEVILLQGFGDTLSVEARSPELIDDAFLRGDADYSGKVEITDPVVSLNCLFLGQSGCADCYDAFDSNDDGNADISDAVFTLSWLFLGGPIPPAPGPNACGDDPTPDEFPACIYEALECLGGRAP